MNIEADDIRLIDHSAKDVSTKAEHQHMPWNVRVVPLHHAQRRKFAHRRHQNNAGTRHGDNFGTHTVHPVGRPQQQDDNKGQRRANFTRANLTELRQFPFQAIHAAFNFRLSIFFLNGENPASSGVPGNGTLNQRQWTQGNEPVAVIDFESRLLHHRDRQQVSCGTGDKGAGRHVIRQQVQQHHVAPDVIAFFPAGRTVDGSDNHKQR